MSRMVARVCCGGGRDRKVNPEPHSACREPQAKVAVLCACSSSCSPGDPTSDIWSILCICAIACPTLELHSSQGGASFGPCAVTVLLPYRTHCLKLYAPEPCPERSGLASGHIQRWLKALCRELRSELASQALLVKPSSVGPPLAPALTGRRRSSWRSMAWRSRMYTQGSRIWFHDARRTARKSGRCRELEFQPPMASTTNTCEKSSCEQWSGWERRVGWKVRMRGRAKQDKCRSVWEGE